MTEASTERHSGAYVVLGVDGGGTRTSLRVGLAGRAADELAGAPCPASGHRPWRVLREITVDAPLHGTVGPEAYPGSLTGILEAADEILDEEGQHNAPVVVAIGAAGVTSATRDDMERALVDALQGAMGGRIRAAVACNDVVALLVGHAADGAIIAGTGSNVLLRVGMSAHPPTIAVPAAEDLIQVGGQDWVVSDEGSGFWVGLTGMRQAYRDVEDGVASELACRLLSAYGLGPGQAPELIPHLRGAAVAGPDMKRGVARFAVSVCEAARAGDAAAQDLVRAQAEALADRMALGMRRHLGPRRWDRGMRFVQCGGLIGNDFFRRRFEERLAMRTGAGCDWPVEWLRVQDGLDAVTAMGCALADPRERRRLCSPAARQPHWVGVS
ncbi:MAG: BadF/BadG/BcrA/BcrD ATPase family protein [Dermatophilaceae bacterium]